MIKTKFFLFLYILIIITQFTKSKFENPNDNYIFNDEMIYNTNSTDNNSEKTNSWFNIKNLTSFGHFHLILSFLVIPALCVTLIMRDMQEDKIIKNRIGLSSNEKVRYEYGLFKNTFIIRSKYLFSWFLFKYHYPLTNILFIYNYNHPRFIRLIIFIITILFNTLLTSLLYITWHTHIYPNGDNIFDFSHIIVSFVFSIIICILMEILINYTTKYIFEFDKIRREIFKSKFEILRRYIYYFVKKDILFSSKWHLIRNRIITYYRLCGPLLLSQVKKNKYQKYVNNKTKGSNEDYRLFSIYSIIPSNSSSFVSINRNVSRSQNNLKENLLIERSDSPRDEIVKKNSFLSSS